jgi:peptidoglycan hydrolase-like protein with peptidoglycan-binding domain
MKKYLPLLLALALTSAVHADDRTRNAQSALKDAGFYFGPITGEMNPDTSAAIRRYQIRNGLDVTGELNQATMDALSNSSEPGQEQPAPQPPAPPVRPANPPQVPPQIPGRVPQNPPPEEGEVRQNGSEPLVPFAKLFADTPYERAPLPVQQETLRRVQGKLASKGFYRGPVNGMPSETVRRAVAAYQDARGLRPSGRLDMDTLHQMQMLPGESSSGFGTGQGQPPQRKIYRGIEVR